MMPQEKQDRITKEKNTVRIKLGTIKNKISKDDILDWFSKLCFFKPVRMSIPQKITRYNADIFEQTIRTDDSYTNYWLESRSNYHIGVIYNSTLSFDITIPLNIWQEREQELTNFLQEFFVRIDGCFGYAVNCFDHFFIQNPMDIGTYERWQIDDTDFLGVKCIPFVSMKNDPTHLIVYPSYLPGHRESLYNVSLTISPYMWIGPDFYRAIPEKTLRTFNNCEENVEFAPGFRKICLWKDIYDYNHPTYRERQWAFRKITNWVEVMQDLYKIFPLHETDEDKKHAAIEIFRGSFPNGGTLLARFYIDNHGRSCEKFKAYAYIEREMDGNTILRQERIKINPK